MFGAVCHTTMHTGGNLTPADTLYADARRDVVRKTSSALSRVANTKAQQEKGAKKKTSKKASLGGGKGGAGAFDDYSAYGGGEDGFDDGFM